MLKLFNYFSNFYDYKIYYLNQNLIFVQNKKSVRSGANYTSVMSSSESRDNRKMKKKYSSRQAI